MISRIRGKIGFLQKILAMPFIKLRIDPNLISVLGLILALIGAFFVTQQNWFLALIFFILAPTMDLIDGATARALNKRSNWGNYFETMIDKLVDFAMLGSFAFIPIYSIPAILALGFSSISSYAKPRVGLIIITDNRDWPAIGEHADKLIILLVGLLLAVLGFNYLEYFLYLIALISAIGSVQRIIYARGLIKEAERKGTLLPYIKKNKER
ncbi:MAG: CDP-alcohol phosphatidyltransferase family protein [Candidatus ainarchaeum sp.]|jgi:archaetidylinositol phosphate synthase|nr:CDP-alcohol phosphatidyltransferase family protein [Candidatus ainarchaeum sp.]MDD4128738.1 CDP-alcohol phosphatidyltransferase family protein [Candidatus ainarchaeum sp.]